jgi:fructokinase
MIQPRGESHGRHRFDLVSIGEILYDFVAPDSPDLGAAVDFVRAPGGAPANVAVAAARLGSRVAFVGAVGDDAFGRTLAAVLRAEGVDTTALRIAPLPTTLAFVAQNEAGIPDFVFYRGADGELRPQDVPAEVLLSSRYLYVSSMALMSEPSKSATLYASEMAREAGVLVAVDPNLRPTSWPSLYEARKAILPLARSADILKLNDEEARLLAETRDLGEAMSALSGDRSLVVVTLGAGGSHWRHGEASGFIPASPVKVSDTTGAGDAFMGALLAELAARGYSPEGSAELDLANLEAALRVASAAGAFSCTKLGAMSSLPTRGQMQELFG